MAPIDEKQVADEVVSVVNLSDGTHQRSAARIDRRPYIFSTTNSTNCSSILPRAARSLVMYDCCRRDALTSATRFRYATEERADKSISHGQITAYVSTQAYRHGEALIDGGRIRPNQYGNHGDADGYDVKTNVGFELEFENGEIIDHDCWCGSTLNPCEHIALLLALPDVAECYV